MFRLSLSRIFLIGLLFFLFSACAHHVEPTGSCISDSMVKELSGIKGKYVWNNELKRYVYSEKLRIEEILSTRETEQALTTLASCLDNYKLSNSILQNKRVAIGIICYEAISQTAYYEHTTQNGDIAKKWSGHILPTATPDELRKAKQAWEKVIASKSYILL